MKFKGSYVVLICIWLDKPYFQEALQFAKILIKRYIEVMIDIMVWITPRWASELARLPPGTAHWVETIWSKGPISSKNN